VGAIRLRVNDASTYIYIYDSRITILRQLLRAINKRPVAFLNPEFLVSWHFLSFHVRLAWRRELYFLIYALFLSTFFLPPFMCKGKAHPRTGHEGP